MSDERLADRLATVTHVGALIAGVAAVVLGSLVVADRVTKRVLESEGRRGGYGQL